MSDGGFDTERLASLDEFGGKKTIIPAEVRGYYRTRRTAVHGVLILFFLLLPWIRVNGRQALLLDVVHRKFSFFGLQLFSHDAPLLFYVFAITAFGLIFVTSVWGRIWCGWACPQTVFIDGIFRRIEILTEGKFLERRRSLTQPMTFFRFIRKTHKWILFLIVSSIIAHSFIAVFVGADVLLMMLKQGPRDNIAYFILISSVTALILFDFGWFREQFCTIVCPYGRFQSVLLDQTSLAVIYDENRGEPRRGKPPTNGRYGDCVSCRRCVEVCPTGIDIRRGVQMECIACTACIDACDDVMTKMKKPTGLIRYSNMQGSTWKLVKSRSLLAATLVVLAAFALFLSLSRRGILDLAILRAKDALFQQIADSDGSEKVINRFQIHVRNQTSTKQLVTITTDEPGVEITLPENPYPLRSDQDVKIPMFIKFLPSILQSRAEKIIQLKIQTEGAAVVMKDVHLLGPVQSGR